MQQIPAPLGEEPARSVPGAPSSPRLASVSPRMLGPVKPLHLELADSPIQLLTASGVTSLWLEISTALMRFGTSAPTPSATTVAATRRQCCEAVHRAL